MTSITEWITYEESDDSLTPNRPTIIWDSHGHSFLYSPALVNEDSPALVNEDSGSSMNEGANR